MIADGSDFSEIGAHLQARGLNFTAEQVRSRLRTKEFKAAAAAPAPASASTEVDEPVVSLLALVGKIRVEYGVGPGPHRDVLDRAEKSAYGELQKGSFKERAVRLLRDC